MSTGTLDPRSIATATQPETPRRSAKHIPTLDGLRAFAILGVVMYHFIPSGDNSFGIALRKVADFGGSGVALFFVISGFLITGILADSRDRDGYFINFYARRSLRIFPLYYGVLVVFLIIVPLLHPDLDAKYTELIDKQFWLWVYLQNIYEAVVAKPIPILGHLWSLAVEEQFYLIWPFVVFMLSRRAVMNCCLALMLVTFFTRGLAHLVTTDFSFAQRFTLFHTDKLAAGAWLALAIRQPSRSRYLESFTTWAAILIGSLIALDIFLTFPIFRGDWMGAFFTVLGGVCFAAILAKVAGVAGGPVLPWLFGNPVLRWIGKISYALYVFHWPLGRFMQDQMDHHHILAGHTWSSEMARFPIILLASCLAAWISWHAYEKWFLHLKRFFETEPPTSAAKVSSMDIQASSGTVAALSEKRSAGPFLLIASDFIKTGGMDRANYALALWLAQQGHAVHLVSHRVDEALLALPNVTFHHVKRPLNSTLLGGRLIHRVGKRIARQITAAGGRVVVNGGNCDWPDVNWVHYVHACYTPTSNAGLMRKMKTQVAQGLALWEEFAVIPHARLVIADSERTHRDVLTHFKLPPERVKTIYYGIDPEKFQPPSEAHRVACRQKLNWPADRPHAIFIGALGDRRKGFDTLYAAFAELCKDPSWNVDLAVIGRGGELPLWQKRAADAGLANRIHFLGFRSDVPDVLAACDILVAPTRYEAYGLGVHEALCCGLPALVTHDAGVAERYPDDLKSLLIQDPNDVAALVRQFKAWQANAANLRARTAQLATELRAYTWDHMAQDMFNATLGAPPL